MKKLRWCSRRNGSGVMSGARGLGGARRCSWRMARGAGDFRNGAEQVDRVLLVMNEKRSPQDAETTRRRWCRCSIAAVHRRPACATTVRRSGDALVPPVEGLLAGSICRMGPAAGQEQMRENKGPPPRLRKSSMARRCDAAGGAPIPRESSRSVQASNAAITFAAMQPSGGGPADGEPTA